MIPQSEEVDRQELLPLLDEIALRCLEHDLPLITVVTTNFRDGRVDYDAVRRHWKIRYGVDPGSIAVVGLHAAELQKCFDQADRIKASLDGPGGV